MSVNRILIPDARDSLTSTNRNERHRLALFADWLDRTGRRYDNVRHADLEEYISYLELERTLAPSTVYAHILTIRSRYNELARRGTNQFCPPTPFKPPKQAMSGFGFPQAPRGHTSAQISSPFPSHSSRLFSGQGGSMPPLVFWDTLTKGILAKVRQHDAPERIWLTIDQANTLLQSPDTDTLHGIRDAALIALMLSTGLRESEVRALDVPDVSHEMSDGLPALHVPEKPGCTERLIPYGDMLGARDLAYDWLDAAGITKGPLFRGIYKGGKGLRPGRISLRAIGMILASYPIDTDEGPLKVTSLILRRTYARLLYRAGVRVAAIQQYLGLGSSDTALDYIGLTNDDIPPSLYSF